MEEPDYKKSLVHNTPGGEMSNLSDFKKTIWGHVCQEYSAAATSVCLQTEVTGGSDYDMPVVYDVKFKNFCWNNFQIRKI